MTFDRDLALRVRIALTGVPDATTSDGDPRRLDTRRVFGGIAFMVGGHIACGVVGQELMLRPGPEAAAEGWASHTSGR